MYIGSGWSKGPRRSWDGIGMARTVLLFLLTLVSGHFVVSPLLCFKFDYYPNTPHSLYGAPVTAGKGAGRQTRKDYPSSDEKWIPDFDSLHNT
jgi:hypothetical protein